MLFKSLRKLVASVISPELRSERDRFEDEKIFLINQIDDLEVWCGQDFPILTDCVNQVLKNYRVHFMRYHDYQQLAQQKRYDELDAVPVHELRQRLRIKYLGKKDYYG